MPLSDGDYLILAQKILETLAADTGAGGLRETGNPPVNLIETGLYDEPKIYAAHQLPAIALSILGMSEAAQNSGKTIAKIFRLVFCIFARGANRSQIEEQVKRIAGRLENLIRAQSAAGLQFSGLPAALENSDGVLLAQVKSSAFTAAKTPGLKNDSTVAAEIHADIYLPVTLNF